MVFPNHFIGQLNHILSQKSRSSKDDPEQGPHHNQDGGNDHPTDLGGQVIHSDSIYDRQPLEDDLDGEPMDDIDGEVMDDIDGEPF
jgi:U2-associated protein SR140